MGWKGGMVPRCACLISRSRGSPFFLFSFLFRFQGWSQQQRTRFFRSVKSSVVHRKRKVKAIQATQATQAIQLSNQLFQNLQSRSHGKRRALTLPGLIFATQVVDMNDSAYSSITGCIQPRHNSSQVGTISIPSSQYPCYFGEFSCSNRNAFRFQGLTQIDIVLYKLSK